MRWHGLLDGFCNIHDANHALTSNPPVTIGDQRPAVVTVRERGRNR